MDVAVADAHNQASLTEAFKEGNSLFVITPETGQEKDLIADAKSMLQTYKKALKNSPIRMVVGISSFGAQHEKGTGSIQVSYLLEHAFTELPVQQIFIRPTYYFKNWMAYLPVVQEQGVLPSFFPPDFEMSMVSPQDVGKLAAQILADPPVNNRIYELKGPQVYSVADVARCFANELKKEVQVQQIPRNEWEQTMKKEGLSPSATANFIEMTEAVLEGRTKPEGGSTIAAKGTTTLEEYIHEAITSTAAD